MILENELLTIDIDSKLQISMNNNAMEEYKLLEVEKYLFSNGFKFESKDGDSLYLESADFRDEELNLKMIL